METTTRTTRRIENVPTEDTKSRVAGVAVGLRLLMGWIFLTAGIGKLTGEPFDAAGYLANVDPASPAAGIYGAMAANPVVMDLINVAVPWGQVLIGVGLLVGGLVRLAAFFGTLMMGAFYVGNWDVANGLVNADLVYLVVFLALVVLAAGRYWGLDALLARHEVDGEPAIERYPRLRYLVG
ncbi:DoxX family membrane protein [Halalkalicoccus jeotgali]|uniref:DoxX family protein n=1 Tax=Halalkalicoccus jeotgali (strain DSM 18796 / CECT 7217 / JCM 14584 / KCTC 4019 / B3) TaxID=795797 RepID=D8J3J3_HALJB|nr:DoxX family membrane protein [Halalkalicoccus jeotgali]ADJ15300.1 DoxX family protein [Halalkalicoccus jeotgali B3]ELY35487.1 DoxX family protein [Halalkalicoccus jeotgali B3]